MESTGDLSIADFYDYDPKLMSIGVTSERYTDNNVVEYKVELQFANIEHIVYRRYNQFKSFHSLLKSAFPRLDLPTFPSKFTMINKTEQRKRDFHNYMNGIIVLCAKFPPMAKTSLMKIVGEFLDISGNVKKTEERVKTSKDNIVESAQIFPSTGHYTGDIDVIITEEDWITYYGSIIRNDLYLFPKDKPGSYFTTVISCSGAVIRENEVLNVLEIHHSHQSKPILLRPSSKDYSEWKNHLFIMASANQDSPLTSQKITVAGRLMVKVWSGQNIRVNKPAASLVKSHVFVRLSLNPFSFTTSILPQGDLVDWGQTFIMPIVNRFFVLKIEICSFSSEGWLNKHAKEDLIEEFNIPLTDINQYPYTNGPITLYFKMQDPKRKKSTANEDMPAYINVDIIHQADFLCNFLPVPPHFIEDEPTPIKATLKQLKIASKRSKRVRILYTRSFKRIYQMFLWVYPKVSAVCMALYIILAIFLPGQYVLPLIMLIFLSFILINNPKLSPYTQKFIDKIFSDEQRICKPPKIQTIKETEFDTKSNVRIFEIEIKEGVMDKWNKFKIDAVELQILLMEISCFLEKMRNLFLWEDPQKSSYFCIGVVMVAFVLYCIPFRALVLILGVHRFWKGKKFTKRRIENNTKVCEEILNSLLSQYLNNYDYYKNYKSVIWPIELVTNMNLQKKIVEGIRSRLNLDVDTKIYEIYTTPEELCEGLSSVEIMLKMRDAKGNLIHDPSKFEKKNFIAGFLSNIPSEYFRYYHPRVSGIETCN